MGYRPIIASGILLLVVSTRVAAQATAADDRPHSFGAGSQWAYPYRGNDELKAIPGIEVAYRDWVRPHVAVELEFGSWRKTYAGTYNLAGYEIPPAHKGEIVYGTYTTHVSSYSAGVNVLGRIPVGRVAIVAGGGPGLFVDERDDASVVNDALQTWSSKSTHVGIQSLAAVDLRVTDRWCVFAGARAELRAIDSLVTYPIAGVRFNF